MYPRLSAGVVFFLAANFAVADSVPVLIKSFEQEVPVRLNGEELGLGGEIRGIKMAADGQVEVRTAEAAKTVVRAGATGLGVVESHQFPSLPFPPGAVRDYVRYLDVVYVALQDGVHRLRGGEVQLLLQGECRQLAVNQQGKVAAAMKEGLYFLWTEEGLTPFHVDDGQGRKWGTGDVRGVAFDHGNHLWFATPAGVVQVRPDEARFYTGAEGLPYNDFTCVAAGPGGVVWFGTRKGAVRFDGKEWAYRQGPGWLPGDVVHGIAVDGKGNAWFATDRGLGVIERREMTLREKARHYEEEIDRYIKRTPYGYTSEVGLRRPGDRSEIIYSDSDNDGLWTSMMGASQCFGYAATQDPALKVRAKQAFEALRFLQKVTQEGEHVPPRGYVARTIRSTEDPDPNIGRVEQDREKQEKEDALWKVYEPRWPKSGDGKWYWKTDTSSDELDGHYFFYPAYYDYCADTEEEKERVREVVRDLTDHLVEHGYRLIDIDGKPTRWGIYDPENLNGNPLWWHERGLNSLSILSYLWVAHHVTGDEKYAEHARRLCEEHAYGQNLMYPKMQYGHGSGNQSDDEMAVMSFYNLMKYTQDEKLRSQAHYAFYAYFCTEFPEMNPFFNFAYAAFGLNSMFTDQWGTVPLGPWTGWLDDSVAALKGFPLDRVNWPRENSHRIDLLLLPRIAAGYEPHVPYAPKANRRGYRVNGKVLPVENRFFAHYNTDPWRLDYGGDGRELASGTVYLLPYYMGLYHGFIKEE